MESFLRITIFLDTLFMLHVSIVIPNHKTVFGNWNQFKSYQLLTLKLSQAVPIDLPSIAVFPFNHPSAQVVYYICIQEKLLFALAATNENNSLSFFFSDGKHSLNEKNGWWREREKENKQVDVADRQTDGSTSRRRGNSSGGPDRIFAILKYLSTI